MGIFTPDAVMLAVVDAEALEVLALMDGVLGFVDNGVVDVVLEAVVGNVLDGAKVLIGIGVTAVERVAVGVKKVLPEASSPGVPVAMGNVAGSCCCPRAPMAADQSSRSWMITAFTITIALLYLCDLCIVSVYLITLKKSLICLIIRRKIDRIRTIQSFMHLLFYSYSAYKMSERYLLYKVYIIGKSNK
jgi:hypothetical protein